MSRLRKWFESIVYAGMKPAGAPRGKRLGWLGPLAGPVTGFLDGGARPDDPFYLTNRTLGQRLRLAIAVAVPILLVAGVITLAALGYFDSGAPPVAPPLTPEQVAARMLPNLDKDLKIPTNRDIEVLDVHVEHGTVTKVAGTARNNTDRLIQNAELLFDLTNAASSRLGAVSIKIPRIDAKATVPFSLAIEQRDASIVLVREVRQE